MTTQYLLWPDEFEQNSSDYFKMTSFHLSCVLFQSFILKQRREWGGRTRPDRSVWVFHLSSRVSRRPNGRQVVKRTRKVHRRSDIHAVRNTAEESQEPSSCVDWSSATRLLTAFSVSPPIPCENPDLCPLHENSCHAVINLVAQCWNALWIHYCSAKTVWKEVQ